MNHLSSLIKYVFFTFFVPIWWLQKLLPRKKRLWVFGAWYGHQYSDNSKYLFEYVHTLQNSEIKAVWITKNSDVKRKVSNLGFKTYHANSIKGIWSTLRASKVIVSSGKRDVSFLFTHGAEIVQLWHGNPMKKIGLDDKYSAVHSFFQQVIVKHLFPFAYEYTFDYVVSNAQIFSIDMASAFGVNADRILETGSPRNDAFFRDKFEDFHQHLKNEFIDAKIVYYLPTFRNHKSAVSLFDLSDFDRSKLEKFLNKENIVLISKGHFVDNKLVEENFHGKHSRLIHLVNDQVDDINLLLKDADALITDYSGAYFDFLLTERPIIFAAFDYEAYVSESRELYFNYAEIVSGPIVKNWTELYHAMCFLWEEDNKLLSSKDKNSIFNKYHDGDNSKRLFKKIQQI